MEDELWSLVRVGWVCKTKPLNEEAEGYDLHATPEAVEAVEVLFTKPLNRIVLVQ